MLSRANSKLLSVGSFEGIVRSQLKIHPFALRRYLHPRWSPARTCSCPGGGYFENAVLLGRHCGRHTSSNMDILCDFLLFFVVAVATLEYSFAIIVHFSENLRFASIRKRHQSTSTWTLPLIMWTGALCKHHVEPRNAWLSSSELCKHIFLNLHFEPFQLSPEF